MDVSSVHGDPKAGVVFANNLSATAAHCPRDVHSECCKQERQHDSLYRSGQVGRITAFLRARLFAEMAHNTRNGHEADCARTGRQGARARLVDGNVAGGRPFCETSRRPPHEAQIPTADKMHGKYFRLTAAGSWLIARPYQDRDGSQAAYE